MKPSIRKFSPCLLRYVAGNFALPTCCALLGFVALFLLNNVFDDLADFMEKGAPLKATILYFLAQQPQNLTNVIPISTLLGASFMTLMMGRHNELTAMRAAGLSLMACALPVWVISALLCLVSFTINEFWGPACTRYANSIERRYVSKNKQSTHASFYHPKEHRDWYIAHLNSDGSIKGVSVRQFRTDGSSAQLVTAQSAAYARDRGWTFQNGSVITFDATGKDMAAPPRFFDTLSLPFTESPDTISSHSIDWSLMNIRELRAVLRENIITSPRILRLLKVLLWHRFTFPLASLVAALFGVALTISTDRMGLMKGFAYAVGMLVLFYMAGELFKVLSQNGFLPPFIGGAVPSLAFLALAIVTMYKKQ